MSHTSQNSYSTSQSAAAGFQPDLNLQSPFDNHSFNPANGLSSHSTALPTTLNISAQADATQIDIGFGMNGKNEPDTTTLNLEGMGLSNPAQWSQGLRQIGNAISNWLHRTSAQAFSPSSSDYRGAETISPGLNADAGGVNSPKPLVGIIDTGFGTNDHGRQILDTIQSGDNNASVWLGGGVGNGTWADSLNEFVEVAKASGNPNAVANLSFDLSQLNPDGSISTRYHLTPQEQAALDNAKTNDVLVVTAAGNQGSVMSGIGLASQRYDNVLTVGAAAGSERAPYSSYGPGLDFMADGTANGAQGTSIATANVTGTIADVWAANPALSSDQVVQTLRDTAIDMDQPGPDIKTGFGLVDAEKAIEKATVGIAQAGSSFDSSNLEHDLNLSIDTSLNQANWLSPVAMERPALDAELARSGFKGSKKQANFNLLPQSNQTLRDGSISDSYVRGRASSQTNSIFGRRPIQTLQLGDGIYNPGSKNEYLVSEWQNFLNSQNLSEMLEVDGKFGANTEEATIEFQNKNKLEGDGIVGPKTWNIAREIGFRINNGSRDLTDEISRIGRRASADKPLSQGQVSLNDDSKTVTLWQYDENGRSIPKIDPNKETIVISHGWHSSDESQHIQELAKQASRSDNVQVIAVDWSEISQAELDKIPVPIQTAKWITPVAEYVHSQLKELGVSPNKMTLVGHSLGTYVSSEVAAKFGKVKNIVALDPAFPGKQSRTGYDLDGRTSERELPNDFRDVAHNSLAFVANNSLNGGGIAGDNVMAATAHNSFIVDFEAGFSRNSSAILNDHNNVVNVFTNALNRDLLSLPNLRLPNLQNNWYDNYGNKTDPSSNFRRPDLPGIRGARGQQEGVITAAPRLSPTERWMSGKPDHPNSVGNPVHITGLTRVVDSSGKEETTWT